MTENLEVNKLKRVPEPFGSYVIVKPKDLTKVSKGGIVLVHQDEERARGAMTEGEVVAIGPLAFKDDMNPNGVAWYKVGDRVIFVKYGGKNVYYDKELYIIFRYEDIMCGLAPDISFTDKEDD